MITGAHTVIYSTDPEADRAFLRDTLRFPSAAVGGRGSPFGKERRTRVLPDVR